MSTSAAPQVSTDSSTQMAQSIGLDIGGTKLCAAAIDLTGLSQMEQLPPIADLLPDTHKQPTPQTEDDFINAIVSLVQEVQVNGSSPLPLGIASAGLANPNTGDIMGATGNLPAIQYSPFPLGSKVSKALEGLPVLLENDANAAAYGEYKLGAGKGYQNVVMITLGTGVGCGLIIDGKLHRGAHLSAGEAGHIRVSMTNDRRCTCGRIGCWEIYASGTGLAISGKREIVEVLHSDEAIDLLQGKDVDELTTHDIVAAYARNNELAVSLIDRWHALVASGLGSLMNVLDPEVVVIGGGMAKFVELPRLRKYLNERIMGVMQETPIKMAQLGNKAGMIGAAQLALERFSD